jgi:hypothetical protein
MSALDRYVQYSETSVLCYFLILYLTKCCKFSRGHGKCFFSILLWKSIGEFLKVIHTLRLRIVFKTFYWKSFGKTDDKCTICRRVANSLLLLTEDTICTASMLTSSNESPLETSLREYRRRGEDNLYRHLFLHDF